MLYLNQLEHPIPYPTWVTDAEPGTFEYDYGRKSTVKSSGCGLCSAVMVADRLIPNNTFLLEDALTLSVETGANHGSGTDYKLFAPAFAEKCGLSLEVTDDGEKLIECLKHGGAAVAHCKPCEKETGYIGVFTHGGHYVTVIGVEPDGRLAILDPSNKPGKFDEPGREGKVEVKDNICYCQPEVLAADVKAKAPRCYYLFRRK